MQAKVELGKIADTAVLTIKKRHYLGSSNLRTNPTGGLNGYYRNIATKVYSKFPSNNAETNPLFYVYLMSACVHHTGSGNCGELTGALYLEIMLSNLPLKIKHLVEGRGYSTNDSHQHNSYVMVDNVAYDIWAGKKIKKNRIKAEMGVDEKKHFTTNGIDIDKVSVDAIKTMHENLLNKFAKLFDEEIAADRKKGAMYTTLNNADISDFALLAGEAIPYLFKKFAETVEDSYFDNNTVVAATLQNKIIKDLIYLLEELRQDFLVAPEFDYPDRVKYSDIEIFEALNKLIPNPQFVAFIIAMSYKNSSPKKAISLLSELSIDVGMDPLLKVLDGMAKQNLVGLRDTRGRELESTQYAPAFFQTSAVSSSSLVPAELIFQK